MSLENQFKQLMPHTVTVAPFASLDAYSKPSFGTAVSYRALVEYRTRVVKNSHGEEVVSTATTYLFHAPTTLNVRDRITLPDGSQPPIINLERQSDTSDNYYIAVIT